MIALAKDASKKPSRMQVFVVLPLMQENPTVVPSAYRACLLSIATFLVLACSPILAEAASLYAGINPDLNVSEFKVHYPKSVVIEYPEGGLVADMLDETSWSISAFSPAGSADSKAIEDQINENLVADGSQARVSDIEVDYTSSLTGHPGHATIEYAVIFDGNLVNYIIRARDGPSPALIDMEWRGLSIRDVVHVNEMEINHPFSAIERQEPQLASMITGSEAEDLLRKNTINVGRLLHHPLKDWHFLFDPTVPIREAARFGIDDKASDFAISTYTIGESGVRDTHHTQEFHATFTADREYTVRTIQPYDTGYIHIVGFAQPDMVDGIEIVRVWAGPPDDNTGVGPYTLGWTIFVIFGILGVIIGAGMFLALGHYQKSMSASSHLPQV